jgi:hypothetical protein
VIKASLDGLLVLITKYFNSRKKLRGKTALAYFACTSLTCLGGESLCYFIIMLRNNKLECLFSGKLFPRPNVIMLFTAIIYECL